MKLTMMALAGVLTLAAPCVAFADGPCTDSIATLSRQLSSSPGLGGAQSEPAAGLSVGKQAGSAQPGGGAMKPNDAAQAGGASLTGGGSPGTVGGAAGTAGASVANGQTATSDADVRQQSVGQPTAAEQAMGGARAASGTPPRSREDQISMAKMELQKAVALNASNDASCKQAVDRAQQLAPKS